jgi:hypothetical protein
MRPTGFWGLAFAVAAFVALADLVAHPQGTQTLSNAVTTSEKYALNAELGQTS